MVGPPWWLAPSVQAPLAIVADDRARSLFERLAPTERARVAMALIGMVLVGMTLIALALLGGRRVRRIARSRPRLTRPGEDDWSRKPLAPPERDSVDRPPSESD
jgi:hypothetical protein